jgi:NAD+ diphosphatase
MHERINLAASSLDRAANFRRDDAWMAERLQDARARFVPVWRDHNLVIAGDDPSVVSFGGPPAQKLIEIASEVALLGVVGEVTYFAADLSHHESANLTEIIGAAEFTDIRQARVLLDDGAGALLLQARGLLYWHRHNRFCANCGALTNSAQAGYARVCSSPQCGREHFPRLDPAIIVLVTRQTEAGDVCLLGHKTEWPEGRFSTIAGFVEPGETIEQAVAREVLEETGVTTTETAYQASQPWPFPASLMLAFRARAASDVITVDNQEMAEARWFTRAQIHNGEGGLRLTTGGSISRWLLETWLAEGE